MFIVVTGLDGSGTSTIAEKLSYGEKDSILLKTPSKEYADRNLIDDEVRKYSKVGHFLYYLSATVYMSDYIKNTIDYRSKNVYCVRYLIDTIVSNRVAGLNLDLDYNIYGHEILKPDLTLFVAIDENIRSNRIEARGKSELDKVLDNQNKRAAFLREFKALLPEETIYVNNNNENIDLTIEQVAKEIEGFKANVYNGPVKKYPSLFEKRTGD